MHALALLEESMPPPQPTPIIDQPYFLPIIDQPYHPHPIIVDHITLPIIDQHITLPIIGQPYKTSSSPPPLLLSPPPLPTERCVLKVDLNARLRSGPWVGFRHSWGGRLWASGLGLSCWFFSRLLALPKRGWEAS